jgi:hypothetical protein
MNPVKAKEIEASLAAKGFVRDDTHHVLFWYYSFGSSPAP